MTLVTAQMSVSVDGFYAGPKHTDMQTWLAGPKPPSCPPWWAAANSLCPGLSACSWSRSKSAVFATAWCTCATAPGRNSRAVERAGPRTQGRARAVGTWSQLNGHERDRPETPIDKQLVHEHNALVEHDVEEL